MIRTRAPVSAVTDVMTGLLGGNVSGTLNTFGAD
jgi:hypothetical protein